MAKPTKPSTVWKNGRGKLGVFAPLIGEWRAAAETKMGPVACTRAFAPILNGKYIELNALWRFTASGKARAYSERCLFGADADGVLGFWSFTSDGKRSHGKHAEATDIHPSALCFEAQMDMGLARQIYWPGAEGAVNWAVEARNKKGWRRFTEHVYTRAV